MKLKAGKRYVTTEGDITGPMTRLSDDGWWSASLKDRQWCTWRENGSYWSDRASQLDLVREYKPPVPDGWKLVPIKPTRKMLMSVDKITVPTISCAEETWELMLKAAPRRRTR